MQCAGRALDAIAAARTGDEQSKLKAAKALHALDSLVSSSVGAQVTSSIGEREEVWGVLVNLLREYAAAVTAAGGHRGGGEEARLACRLLNQCTYTPDSGPQLSAAIGRRCQDLIYPKATCVLTVLMQQTVDANLSQEAAGLMYSVERVVAEADFASRHARRLAEIPSQSPPGALAPTHEYN
eukprot:Tamp_03382.p2 GENE.Tamp_03382~~Tamp_03382.p2  ORF type:complete len:182 (-),score=29.51 Tamp_03382:3209-3754(-)